MGDEEDPNVGSWTWGCRKHRDRVRLAKWFLLSLMAGSALVLFFTSSFGTTRAESAIARTAQHITAGVNTVMEKSAHESMKLVRGTGTNIEQELCLITTDRNETFSLSKTCNKHFAGGRPSVLGIGCMKCGSSTIWRILKTHPDFVPGDKKEVRMFEERWLEHPEWDKKPYKAYREYQKNFKPGLFDTRIEQGFSPFTADFTPSYHAYADIFTRRISLLGLHPKLIFVLRDPVERLWSHYNFHYRIAPVSEVTAGKVPKKTEMWPAFEDWIAKDMELLERCDLRADTTIDEYTKCYEHEAYAIFAKDYPYGMRVGRGLYYFQLRRLLQKWDPSEILLICWKHLRHDTTNTMDMVWDFLGVDRITPSDEGDRNVRATQYKATISPATLRSIESFYAPFNQMLAEFGIDCGWGDSYANGHELPHGNIELGDTLVSIKRKPMVTDAPPPDAIRGRLKRLRGEHATERERTRKPHQDPSKGLERDPADLERRRKERKTRNGGRTRKRDEKRTRRSHNEEKDNV